MMSDSNADNVANHDSLSAENQSKLQSRLTRLLPTMNQPHRLQRSKSDLSTEGAEQHDSQASKKLVSLFCSFALLAKFPYKYMNDPDGGISRDFFASNKFFDRKWHLYCLYPPDSVGGKPLFLVPFGQARRLIDDIASSLEQKVTVPQFPFTIPFYDDGTPQPHFLGVSECRSDAELIQNKAKIESSSFNPCPVNATLSQQDDFEAWIKKFSEVQLAAGAKGKKSRGRKSAAENRAINIEECRAQIKRAQRYLGFRPAITDLAIGSESLQTQGTEACQLDTQRNHKAVVEFLDATKCAPYPFDKEPIFICIDVEANELDHKQITEIGVSTLDTRELRGTPPTTTAQSWLDKIRSRHFRIKGTERIRNSRFCVGDPNGFSFGQSEWVSLINAADVVDSCFEWPYSKRLSASPALKDDLDLDEDPEGGGVELRKEEDREQGEKDRNIILIGHDIKNDIGYLSRLGSEILGSSTGHNLIQTAHDAFARKARPWILTKIIECLDTSTLDRTIQNASQHRSLAKLCESLEIEPWGLHNAGNDAHYTLEAFVKMLLNERNREDAEHKAENPNASNFVESPDELETQLRIQNQMAAANDRLKSQLEEATAACIGFTVSFHKGLCTIDLEKDARKLLEEDDSLDAGQKTELLYARHGINVNDPSLQWSWNTVYESSAQDVLPANDVQQGKGKETGSVAGSCINTNQEILFEKTGKRAKRVQPKHGW